MKKKTPSLRGNKGRARVTLDGREYPCGAWDTKHDCPTTEAQRERVVQPGSTVGCEYVEIRNRGGTLGRRRPGAWLLVVGRRPS